MREILPQSLYHLAQALDAPLYAVGGCVRDRLAKLVPVTDKRDFDICAPIDADTLVSTAQARGFSVRAVYKTTGTVKLSDGAGNDFEYSCFRSDKYVRGVHTPVEITFTKDISLDARRRDFTANAVYYDLKAEAFVDPLDGISAIREKRLTTVAPPEKVFGEDGLRLMRLARQAAQLGFSPDEACLYGAAKNADLIKDVTPERIFAELSLLLAADGKYGVFFGQYFGVRLLDKTRVLDRIMPELTLGRDLKQRADFHDHDVLGHSLLAVKYADPRVRFAALLHDVGKPYCFQRDGNGYAHPEEGALIAERILTRLKVPKRLVAQVSALTALHMYDFDCRTKAQKLRRFFVSHAPILEELLLLKQADFSACKEDTSVAPTVQKWRSALSAMQAEGAPLTLKSLAVTGKDLLSAGITPERISERLEALLLHAATNPADNNKARLLSLVFKLPYTR